MQNYLTPRARLWYNGLLNSS